VQALYGCAGFRGCEKNLFTIDVVSGHPWRIRTPRSSQAR
jgi:hypothetical protein